MPPGLEDDEVGRVHVTKSQTAGRQQNERQASTQPKAA